MNTPTEPGFYWAKDTEGWKVVQVFRGVNRIYAMCINETWAFKLDWFSEWAGPVEPPREGEQ